MEHEVTLLLDRWRGGDRDAEARLFEIVLPDLRLIAKRLLNGERRDHTLQATELVNRMYLRLTGAQLSLRDRAHFFAIAARAMRRELIDYARSRPHIEVLPLEGFPELAAWSGSRQDAALLIDLLLDQLRDANPQACTIVELKFFFGLTDEEAAEALSLPVRTLQAKWQDARIWLFERAEARQWKPSPNPH
jgi:RNA polymerase sigma factor (TIGR02999 family)